MAIDVTCPSCGVKLRTPDKNAGYETNCPKCGNSMSIPSIPIQAKPQKQEAALPQVPAPPTQNVVTCPHCDGIMEMPEHLAGQLVECPHCRGHLTVPRRAPVPQQNTAITSTSPISKDSSGMGWGEGQPPPLIPKNVMPKSNVNFKSCPFCGEQIWSVAKKCKHCGELFVNHHRNTDQRPGVGFGVTSLVLGILSFLLCCTILSLPLSVLAVIFGSIGIGTEGQGMAIGGLVMGLISLGIIVASLFIGIGMIALPFAR